MKNSDLSNEFCKAMQNLETLLFEGNIEDFQIIDLIGKYSVIIFILKKINNIQIKIICFVIY